jgi:hypothetical protein
MPRPVDWNDETSRFAVILRDFATCNNVNGQPGGVVALSRRGQRILEVWVRDCTPAEMTGDWEAPVPNDTFTTGPHDAPDVPADLLDDVPATGATGQPGSNAWVSRVIDNILAGQTGTAAWEEWKVARCKDAIVAHQALRV